MASGPFRLLERFVSSDDRPEQRRDNCTQSRQTDASGVPSEAAVWRETVRLLHPESQEVHSSPVDESTASDDTPDGATAERRVTADSATDSGQSAVIDTFPVRGVTWHRYYLSVAGTGTVVLLGNRLSGGTVLRSAVDTFAVCLFCLLVLSGVYQAYTRRNIELGDESTSNSS